MNLRQLRAFATIADVGGFARAATHLHLSQPALSRQIHTLEADLGVPLFDRIGRRVQLTSQGEDLLRRGRRLLAEAESLSERARQLKSGETGILRVAATPQVIENLLAPFLTHYRHRHPGVEVHLVEDGGARLLGRLERGEAHFSITPAGATRFEGQLLYPIHVVAALPSTHRLARRPLLEVAELEDEPLLLPQRGFGSREWFDIACDMAHMRPRVLLESAAPHTLVALAATDYGIAILPSNARLPSDGVRAIPLVHRGASIGRWAHIAWDPQRFLAPYAEHFKIELAAHCRRDFPGRGFIKRAPPLAQPGKQRTQRPERRKDA
jgi:DNA-binding transcriptional LysR family regulator